MPHKCCIPNCKRNYNSNNKVTIFSFPKDEEIKLKWLEAIPRKNLVITNRTKVCQMHFKDEDVEHRTYFLDESTGELLSSKLKKPRLGKYAVPSIFPDCSTFDEKLQIPKTKKKRSKKKLPVNGNAERITSKKFYDTDSTESQPTVQDNKCSSGENDIFKTASYIPSALSKNLIAETVNGNAISTESPNHLSTSDLGKNSPVLLSQKVKLKDDDAIPSHFKNSKVEENGNITPCGGNESLQFFFNSMYNTTQELPMHLQLQVKKKLFEIITKAEEDYCILQDQQEKQDKEYHAKDFL